jgi:hypothetical protein
MAPGTVLAEVSKPREEKRVEVLAIEEKFRPELTRLLCETDFLVRAKPVLESLNRLAVMELTPEAQRRWHEKLNRLWHEVFTGLPDAGKPSFSASEFTNAVRDGKMSTEKLLGSVVLNLSRGCETRLKMLAEQPAQQRFQVERCLRSLFACWQETGAMTSHTMHPETTKLFERFDRLPDLLALAQAGSVPDRYAEQDRLAREHDAQKKPYLLSMPYRQPGHPCSSGEHTPPAIKHTLVNPLRNERAELWESELHEARHHGAALPAAAATMLDNLPEIGR